MQYFAAFEPFEVFEEFNGVPGTYIKSFLISDVINLNKWQATHEANIANLDTFMGRPGIHYINPENGKRDHTGATTFEKSLQLQELYRAASIIAVGSDISTKKNWQMSRMVDDDVAEKIKSGDIKFISPSIWPDEDAVEIIKETDGSTVERVHAYRGLHYAFVDEPAYGIDAEIKAFCDGTTKACQIELARFNASIDQVGPITDKKIIIPKKKKGKGQAKSKTKYSSDDDPDTSHNTNSTLNKTMATQEELQKKLDEAETALKATEEELEKLKDKEAKRAAQEPEEEEKDSKAKKAEEEEEDKEKEAMKARIATLEKEPIVEKIVSAQLSAGIIAEDKVPEITSSLMAASKDELVRTLNTSKSYEAKLNSLSASVSVPNMGSFSASSTYDASLDSVDDEELLMAVGGQ